VPCWLIDASEPPKTPHMANSAAHTYDEHDGFMIRVATLRETEASQAVDRELPFDAYTASFDAQRIETQFN